MLLDILGILIAFASSMLFFSLMVTSIGHGVQGLVSKRYRVLRRQLQRFAEGLAREMPQTAGYLAVAVEQMLDQSSLDGAMIKDTAHVAKDELKARILRLAGHTPSAPAEPISEGAEQSLQALETLFPKLELTMSREFKLWMDKLSLAVAFVLAVVFHLNAFDLLSDLSSRPERLAAFTQYGSQALVALPEPVPVDITHLQDPIAGQAAMFDFSLFPRHCQCYLVPSDWARSVSNLVGILISALLISLGAPFWFQTLQRLFRLREQLPGPR